MAIFGLVDADDMLAEGSEVRGAARRGLAQAEQRGEAGPQEPRGAEHTPQAEKRA